MKNTAFSPTATRLGVADISKLLAEIGDLVFTRNQIEADQEAIRRAMHEACEPVKAPFVTEQERLADTIHKLCASIDARAEIVEEWCCAHKDARFPLGQRTQIAGGMIHGFRLSNPHVEELAPRTRWQRFLHLLAWKTWGGRWLRAPQIDKRKVLADAAFLTRHPLLSNWLGLAIVQQDEFILKPAPQPARTAAPVGPEQEAA